MSLQSPHGQSKLPDRLGFRYCLRLLLAKWSRVGQPASLNLSFLIWKMDTWLTTLLGCTGLSEMVCNYLARSRRLANGKYAILGPR